MSELALEIKGLSKQFGGLPAVSDVTLAIRPGERHLLLGPNGAGKTTLFNLICGDLPPTAGSIRLFGQELVGLPPRKRTACGLARTYQILTLFPHETLCRNVMLALNGLRPQKWRFWRDFDDDTDMRAEAFAILERVKLADLADRTVSQTAYGDRRRLEIALALALAPRVLLLDEPLAGLSRDERVMVQELLDTLPQDITIVLIEHDMDVALAFAERITLLHHGSVVITGSRAEIAADPRTREVYLGA
ncbi:ATP-binding cassette domain-containing protein [Xanthobacter autotrophicus]|jgi:branched-chain amino acid transport system ATP-binding protein|uniref:ATP-binding cassette domain-containing protein n=1 Tax=Xanthobacter autotrophicus TaxID=280 RepID=A0A6C1K908_XANAU|nr:ATP-binding cassette domain-containing protein [Xanthobacter autotrophicus]TLX40682.1 ATP-binding cassette domain-containing protein [Xanthobacter autotrophicus]